MQRPTLPHALLRIANLPRQKSGGLSPSSPATVGATSRPSTPISTTCFTGVRWEGRALSRPPKPSPNAATANAAQQPTTNNLLFTVFSPYL